MKDKVNFETDNFFEEINELKKEIQKRKKDKDKENGKTNKRGNY